MKRIVIATFLALAACNGDQDRLTDAQASRDPAPGVQAVPVEQADSEPTVLAEPAPNPGEVIYKALGSEPGWALTIRRNAMLYQGDYGTVRIVEATPPAFTAKAGTTRSGRLSVTIASGPCSDGMSDKVWRDRVTVAVAGGTIARGCGGGVVQPNSLENSSWTVSAINGRSTGGGPRYAIQFAEADVRGAFGCNSFSARFARNGDHVAVTQLLATQMACGDPAGTFEREGFAVLNSNMRLEQVEGRTRLVSEAGSIDLVATPPEEKS